MKYARPASVPLTLLLAATASAQDAPPEPQPAQYPPLIIEAESGTGGADFTLAVESDVSFVSINPSDPTPAFPGSPARVLSYQVELPAAGEYELYVRVRVGPAGGSDDSLFYGNGFGEKDATNDADWVTVNGLSTVGYQAPDLIVAGGLGVPLGAGFKWLNLSAYNGGDAPLRFSVAEGSLVQTLQIGAREDGLDIDKLAFVATGVSQTVAELDAGLPGNILPPAPPPRVCVPRGPALAVNQSKFLGSVYSAAQLPNFTAYFNQVTPENAGKWGAVEAVRDVMDWTQLDAAYAFAKDNGLPFKMHTLIWGNQQPAWIETLPPEEQLAEIEEWFAAVAERYPELDQIDVVNEPLHDPPTTAGSGGGNYAEALGGAGETGWDWVITAYRLARQYFPSSQLLLNDYSIINTPASVERYKQIISLLQAEDLIDGIGEQGHAFSTTGANDVMAASLDSLAELGLPIYITEMDIDGPTDEIQLRDYQRLFPLFWEHPAVAGITLWGYLPGHWRSAQGAFLALETGTEKPALAWLREYLQSPPIVPVVAHQRFVVDDLALPGDTVGVALAVDDAANDWQILGGSGAEQFNIDAATGEIRLAEGAVLDPLGEPELTLEVVARDECNSTRVTLAVRHETAPVVAEGQVVALGEDLRPSSPVSASDAEGDALEFELIGGSGAGAFTIVASSGALQPSAGLRFDADEYSLLVTASDGRLTSEPATVVVTLPRRVLMCVAAQSVRVPRSWVPLGLHLGAELGRCGDGAGASEGNPGGSATGDVSWLTQLGGWVDRLLGRG
jgi:endo-1,4-beta-xylanase